jgi:hypothetical protein
MDTDNWRRGWNRCRISIFMLISGVLLVACVAAPVTNSTYDVSALRFSGEDALATEAQFVQNFPYRSSGQPNNQRAAKWLVEEFSGVGLTCHTQEWEVINYSQWVPLRNVVCELPGQEPGQIVLVAHHDQSPDTIQGADNDGSGIAIMLELARIFAAEAPPHYTLVFLSSDGEEYGMLGTRHYIQTHPDLQQVIAGISLDNLGKYFYSGLVMDARGQFRGYGALWLQLLAQEVARSAGDLWVPQINSPLDQILSQAMPVSFMDEGPIVAVGIPSFGFTGYAAPEVSEQNWNSYHNPEDTLDLQSAAVLQQSGRVTEALLRQLLLIESFPQESGPYLYLESSSQVLRGMPLWVIFAGFVMIFFIAAEVARRKVDARHPGWRRALIHILGLWLPLVAAVLLLYLFVAVGLMDEYYLYPATARDEPLFEPRWVAVILWIVGLSLFVWLGRRVGHRLTHNLFPASFIQIKSLAMLIIGLASLYVLLINPFSLLFMLPLLSWFVIAGRRGAGKLTDILLFLLGGLIVYVLFYFFGFVILRNDFAILWYLMMMTSIQMVGFPTLLAATAILAAGISMVVTPPGPVTQEPGSLSQSTNLPAPA